MLPRVAMLMVAGLLLGGSSLYGAANLSLQRQSALVCPAATATLQVPLIFFNPSTAAQTIPAGTRVTYMLSVAITAIVGSQPGVTATVSGKTLTVRFANASDVAPRSTFGLSISIATAGLPDGALVTNTVTVDPPDAIMLADSGTQVIAILEHRACDLAPANALTADDLNAQCPTAAEIRQFNADLTITFDGDPSIRTLVCRAADGSADLTRLQERTYQALRFMQKITFDSPLPFTNKTLYDWLTGAIRGIRYNPNTSASYCCEPANVINIQASSNLAAVVFQTPDALASLILLFVHEARHNQGFPHTCGTWDQTLSELGAWSAQYYTEQWMVFKTGSFFVPKSGNPTAYRAVLWRGATNLLDYGDFCQPEPGLFTLPKRLDFAATAPGSASETQSLTVTQVSGTGRGAPAVGLSGPDATDFVITKNACEGVSVPPDCSVLIKFQPSGPGARTAQLTIGAGITVPITGAAVPSIRPGGIGSLYSPFTTIQPGSWVTIYGSNLSDQTATWNGDFPTSLGGVTVTVNSKPAYLWFVSPEQTNFQVPDDNFPTYVEVVVNGPLGSAKITAIVAAVAPSFNLFDGTHIAGVIPTPDGSGAYANGAYDLAGPTGAFSFNTRPVRVGETVILYGVGFGPTTPRVLAGRVFSGAVPTAFPVQVTIGGVQAAVQFAGMTGAGLYQLNVVVPNVPGGDQVVAATVSGVETPAGRVITVR